MTTVTINTATALQQAQDGLQQAQAKVSSLEAERATTIAQLAPTAARGEALELRRLKAQLRNLDEDLAAGRVLVARAELATIDASLAEHRTQNRAADLNAEGKKARADFEAARVAMEDAEMRRRRVFSRGQMYAQQGEDLQQQHQTTQYGGPRCQDTGRGIAAVHPAR
jgi:flagellar biosynthesis chaperone FliJ